MDGIEGVISVFGTDQRKQSEWFLKSPILQRVQKGTLEKCRTTDCVGSTKAPKMQGLGTVDK